MKMIEEFESWREVVLKCAGVKRKNAGVKKQIVC